jgi:hypothetical protein
MICHVKAMFACDDCGTEFIVSLEPAYEPPAGWSVFAVAEDAIRGGQGYEDGVEGSMPGPWSSGSVGDDGRHYCDRCTRKRDTT